MEERENATTTSVSTPWFGQAPFLQMGFGAAGDLLGRGTQVPASNQQIMQHSGSLPIYGAAKGAQSLVSAGANPQSLIAAARGDYIGKNPYLTDTYNMAAGEVGSSMDARFAGSGRYGSGAWAATKGKALGDLATQIYGGAYETDMNRMLQSAGTLSQLQFQGAGMMPALAEAEYGDHNMRRSIEQSEIDAPWQTLMNYGRTVSGNFGGTTTGTQPMYSNPIGQGIGALGGLAGALYLGSKAFG